MDTLTQNSGIESAATRGRESIHYGGKSRCGDGRRRNCIFECRDRNIPKSARSAALGEHAFSPERCDDGGAC